MINVFEKGMHEFNQEKAGRSMEWAKQFSWKNAAKQYLKLYQEI